MQKSVQKKRKLAFLCTVLVVLIVDAGMVMMWFFEPTRGTKIVMATVCLFSTALLLVEVLCELVLSFKRISAPTDKDDEPEFPEGIFDVEKKPEELKAVVGDESADDDGNEGGDVAIEPVSNSMEDFKADENCGEGGGKNQGDTAADSDSE